MADVERAMSTPIPTGINPELRKVFAKSTTPDTGRVKKPRRKKPAKKAAKKRGRPKGSVATTPKAKRTNTRNAVSMDLSDALGLVQGMHRTDVATFQTISEHLTGKGKPSRRRLLAALNKVFG